MVVTELRCPRCSAPLDPSTAASTACRYCGAALAVHGAPARTRDEEQFTVVARIGPSNVARVADALTRRGGFVAADADALARSGRCAIDTAADGERARLFASLLEESGASVEIVTRVVAVPIPPDIAVHLDDAGGRKLAVIAALREHVELAVAEAKHLVESAPCVLVARIAPEKGEALRAALAAAGARVDLRPLAE